MNPRIETDAMGRKKVYGPCTKPCAIERGMRILGGKWTGSILWHLKDGAVRFNDLARMIGGASKKMITERLRQLEDWGLVERRVLHTSPVAVEYTITPLGATALAFLDELRRWSESLPPALTQAGLNEDMGSAAGETQTAPVNSRRRTTHRPPSRPGTTPGSH